MAARVNTSPLVVIVGPTASGKSDLAMELAIKFNGEIICGDSWTVRRRADIGSAKPSISDQQKVKHHLIDIIEPDDKFSAAEFKDLCLKAIEDIGSRGKLAILVGGSGLYINSVLFDYSFIDSDTSLRDSLNSLSITDLIDLATKKGLSLDSVDTNNKRRIIRHIESGGVKPSRNNLRLNTLLIGLDITNDTLKERIVVRLNKMLKAGLESEVKLLSKDYGWNAEALKGINYYEWEEYFLGQKSREELLQKIAQDNLNLAKKQKTWFKKNKSIHWFTTPVKMTNVVDLITTFNDNLIH
jgi:tRNA dimethylallyltransferase